MQLLHDIKIDIATGRSRLSANWKNRQVLWSEIVKKISETHRTHETYAEYVAETKSRQDEIKDIGGFVGGYLAGGKRKKGSVMHRQIISLDIDFAHSYIWDAFTLIYDCAAAIYSTHKHSPELHRYRLLIPLDRPVFCDEYIAIARRIAGNLGIENFDNTTFEPERLMYWPSTSKDGLFVFDWQDGVILSADSVLQTYVNWKDASEWPVSERVNKVVQREIKKQGDPLEKPGIIGAFCRVYGIAEAIEKFLADVYEPCDVENRYTFKEGSTAAGLVVYENKFTFSHHGTDPASGKLCNSFDLVRLHLFGLQDEESGPDTPGNRLPSFQSMQDFTVKDAEVKKRVGLERIENVVNDFKDSLAEQELADVEPGETNDEWLKDLEVTRKGVPLSTINNIILILENDPKLKGCLAFNEFEQREIALKNLPWRKIKGNKYLTDADDAAFRHYFEKVYSITGVQKIRDGLSVILAKNTFHPVRDYLKGLSWDGGTRVPDMLINYLGAEDCDYTHAVTVKMMAAAVARIMQPGIKFDQITVLVGGQGLKKSMFIDKIGLDWFSDSITTVQGKEAFEALQGVWIIELAELSAMKNSEVEQVKHFASKREDRYRVAYGRRLDNFPRQCVFWATTNKTAFLKDDKNRRFWPVPVHVIPPVLDPAKLTKEEIGQFWAEAVRIYEAGENLYLEDELLKEAEDRQEQHKEADDRAGIIQKYLDTLLPDNWPSMGTYERRSFLQGDELQRVGTVRRDRVCVSEIWAECLGGQVKDFNKRIACDLHTVMENLPGWEKYKSKTDFKIYGTQRAYCRTKLSEKIFEIMQNKKTADN